jgi:hypothetical protein
MARPAPLPPDRDAAAVAAVFRAAADRLRALIARSLASGRIGGVAYRRRVLAATEAVLDELARGSRGSLALAIRDAYLFGASVLDKPPTGVRLPDDLFGRVSPSVEAVRALATAAEFRLTDAIRTVGRSVDDVFRRAALEEVTFGVAAAEATEATAERLRRTLVEEGVTAFTDRSGRRWPLDSYAEMVARTTTREAMTVGTADRLMAAGIDLVTFSDHGASSCPVCRPYQGRTYSLTGATPSYTRLPAPPPVHPRCRHVIYPARAGFAQLERSLGLR